MTTYQPYTYLVGWSTLNAWYYGVEYGSKSKTANPKNLWSTYYTSSKVVKVFRESFGEPDVIEVRKTFETAEKALIWEQKVLRRVNAPDNVKWLNIAQTSGEFHTNNKIVITDGDQQLMIDKVAPIPEGWRSGISDKVRNNRKIGSRKRSVHFTNYAHEKSAEKRKKSTLITNDVISLFHPRGEPIPEGYRKGASKSVCEQRAARASGKICADETKQRISLSRTGFRYINNGILEKQTKNSKLPEGFVWGRLPRTEAHNKNNGASRKGRKWYTDGTKNSLTFECPVGFKLGKIEKPRSDTL